MLADRGGRPTGGRWLLAFERHAGHLVEADHVVLADQAALAIAVVNEHLGDGGLATRDQIGAMRSSTTILARSSRAVGSMPIERIRKSRHSLVVKVERPLARIPSTLGLDIWIGRSPAM